MWERMSTRFDKIGSRTHEGGIGASLENTLAPSTPSRSSIDWKGLPGDGEDEVGGWWGRDGEGRKGKTVRDFLPLLGFQTLHVL